MSCSHPRPSVPYGRGRSHRGGRLVPSAGRALILPRTRHPRRTRPPLPGTVSPFSPMGLITSARRSGHSQILRRPRALAEVNVSIVGPAPLIPPIIFGPQTCASLAAGDAGQREWLVTDGLGGFATGTVSGLRTRRYHGLLVVADPAGAVRRVALAALDLTLTLPSGTKVPLYSHEWASGGHRPRRPPAPGDVQPRRRPPPVAVAGRRRRGRTRAGHAARATLAGRRAPGDVRAGTRWGSPSPRCAPGATRTPAARRRCRAAHRADRRRDRGRGRVPARRARAGSRPATGTSARTPGEEAARGMGAVEDLCMAGSFTARVAPGRTRRRSPPGRATSGPATAGRPSSRPPGSGPTALVAAAKPPRRVRRHPGARRRRVRRATPRPDPTWSPDTRGSAVTSATR